MKPLALVISATVCAASLMLAGCAKENFGDFLTTEIGSLGGKTNQLLHSADLYGKWSVKHDEFGAAINTDGIGFDAITNLLTAAYGEPLFYTGGNERHGPIYLYPPANTGISIFVSWTKRGAEVTLTRSE